MKLRETEFFQQFSALVIGCVLFVASVAFLSIPLTLANHPWGAVPHLT